MWLCRIGSPQECHRGAMSEQDAPVERGADVVDPLAPREWGFDEYVVHDCNGYYLRFVSQLAHTGQ